MDPRARIRFALQLWWVIKAIFVRKMAAGVSWDLNASRLSRSPAVGNPFPFELDTWYHVAVRRDGSRLAAFVDATEIGSTDVGALSIPDPARRAEGWHTARR